MRPTGLALRLLLLGFVACGEDAGSPLIVSSDGALTRCPPVSSSDEDEHVNFDVLNAQIRTNPWLTGVTGVARVGSCAEAHAHVRATQAFLESRPAARRDDGARAGDEPTAARGSDARGVVEILHGGRRCSGWLLTRQVVVTAAHCLPGVAGRATFTVSQHDPSSGRARLLSIENEALPYRRHTSWSGVTGDATRDLGVIVRAAEWRGVDDGDTWPVPVDGLAAAHLVRTRGADHEWADREIVWHGDEYFVSTGGPQARPCQDDAGAPALARLGGIDVVTGVLASIDVAANGSRCLAPHGKTRHTRLDAAKLAWLRAAAGDALGTGPLACRQHGAGARAYLRCR